MGRAGRSEAAAEAYLHGIINDPRTHPTRMASAKRALAFTPAVITRLPNERAQQKPPQAGRSEGPGTVKGLTGSERGVEKAKRPKVVKIHKSVPRTERSATITRPLVHCVTANSARKTEDKKDETS